jgi:hypothetical protein
VSTLVEFKCPGCGRACRLDTATNGMQHEVPRCATYNATRTDGQKFLELANQADPKPFAAVLKIGGGA